MKTAAKQALIMLMLLVTCWILVTVIYGLVDATIHWLRTAGPQNPTVD